ncbi:hypothetical protein K438DRAFT_1982903 [Mycena galopus ATCC 62051]|nr:hypothetical protein K438DRAFT_1982903 [Mycena galopus ATCC 62051]
MRVVVLEERSEIGAHLLSGTVIELSALDALLLEWRMAYPDHALVQPATSSGMRLLTQEYWILFLHPPQTNNRGNSIASLNCVTAWLGGNTEEMGVEVYPGFAGAQFILSLRKKPRGGKGRASSQAWRPMVVMNDLNGKKAQTYGIGVKEVWRVEEGKHVPVLHPRLAALRTHLRRWLGVPADGLVKFSLVGLDHKNPYIESYREVQHTNTTLFRVLLATGTCLACGARALTEGGLRSLPLLGFPGRGVGWVNFAFFEVWVSMYDTAEPRRAFPLGSAHYAT